MHRPASFLITLFFAIALTITVSSAAAEINVNIINRAFDPKEITIHRGDILVFQNNDSVTHNVQIFNQNKEINDMGLQLPNTQRREKFNATGLYQARCAMFPQITMHISVNDAPQTPVRKFIQK